VAAEHGFSFWLAGSAVLGGWADAAWGAPEQGLARLRQGLSNWAATGSVTYRTYYLGLLAETLIGQKLTDEAAAVLKEALDLAERTGEGLYEAELYRLRGALHQARGEPGAAEDFRRAIEVARRQEAQLLELRAAQSLELLGEAAGP
jgi:predicted ATPase